MPIAAGAGGGLLLVLLLVILLRRRRTRNRLRMQEDQQREPSIAAMMDSRNQSKSSTMTAWNPAVYNMGSPAGSGVALYETPQSMYAEVKDQAGPQYHYMDPKERRVTMRMPPGPAAAGVMYERVEGDATSHYHVPSVEDHRTYDEIMLHQPTAAHGYHEPELTSAARGRGGDPRRGLGGTDADGYEVPVPASNYDTPTLTSAASAARAYEQPTLTLARAPGPRLRTARPDLGRHARVRRARARVRTTISDH